MVPVLQTTTKAGQRCLCATVRRASRLLSAFYEEALRPAGLTPTQFETMMTLHHAGPCSQKALASLLETDQTTLSRNLTSLEHERWIETQPDVRDRRRRTYALTALGQAVLKAATEHWSRAHAQMELRVGEPLTTLWPVLDRILAAARPPHNEP